jgi:hypothetical protein
MECLMLKEEEVFYIGMFVVLIINRKKIKMDSIKDKLNHLKIINKRK